ncbi:hypothetical protein QYF36_004973 [Acer negundo]|nr:hypothetical protein QYF36_004973 [Acer negundo]
MFMLRNLIPLLSISLFVTTVDCKSPLLGIHPLDENYFSAEVIKCKDGSKSFTRDRLNDNFCDCIDGTDEPGTSACPAAKFYCRNIGSTPQFIFSSHVNDRICDCCDGSDEYDNSIRCPNTCVMGGNLEYKIGSHVSTISNLESIDAIETKNGVNFEDLIEKLKGLKIVLILQVVLFTICFLVSLNTFPVIYNYPHFAKPGSDARLDYDVLFENLFILNLVLVE